MAHSNKAPVAQKKTHLLEKHGHQRVDPYYWLRERENPEVIRYLEEENAYTENMLGHTAEFQGRLYEEILGRIKKDDASVPYQMGTHFYYSRYEEKGEYPVHCRRPGSANGPESIILNVNQLAEGHDYLSVVGLAVSTDEHLLAYATDTVGRRLYTLRFRDLRTGQDLSDAIPDVTGDHAWANDNQTLFYVRQHPETLRWYRVYRHVLGTDPTQDDLVYEEPDEEFGVSVYKTKTKQYLVIASHQTLSTECRYLSADDPEGTFQVFLPREEKHEYHIDHFGDSFYVTTNWEAQNFRLMRAPVGVSSKDSWVEVIPHRADVLFGGVEVFQNYMVATERKNGLLHIRILDWEGKNGHSLDFGEPAYAAYTDSNAVVDTEILRFYYTSLTTPGSVFHYNMRTKEKTLLKEDVVLGDFDKANYITERLYVPARDGAKVPVSLVYRKDTKLGKNPLLLYAYGSYGYSMDTNFSSARLSLLDRGFVFAIAHIRGGSAMGRQWYEDGKLLKKMNTFTDFVDCARHLVKTGHSDAGRVFAQGGSAGGLLMGAICNLAPEVFHGIVSQVPFVDVVTTMLDEDIPLTTSEYDEWGNPNLKEYYDYMLTYSPYDQIEAKAYPHMLITAGLHDSQVQYWEPAKYVARLRTVKTDSNRLLLKTNMDAGHSGATGRFKAHKETALVYAFLLDLCGLVPSQSA